MGRIPKTSDDRGGSERQRPSGGRPSQPKVQPVRDSNGRGEQHVRFEIQGGRVGLGWEQRQSCRPTMIACDWMRLIGNLCGNEEL